jgi:hypothetical protein
VIGVLTGDAAQGAAIAAGCEEEGVPCEVEVDATPASALERARRAATTAPLGIGVGGDADRVVVALAAAPGQAYVVAPDARAAGHAAGRLAARRPV